MTQATLSRDLKRLGIGKAPTRGRRLYLRPRRGRGQAGLGCHLRAGLHAGVPVRRVLRQPRASCGRFPGTPAAWPPRWTTCASAEVLGTIAGDDTVLVVPRNGVTPFRLMRALRARIPGFPRRSMNESSGSGRNGLHGPGPSADPGGASRGEMHHGRLRRPRPGSRCGPWTPGFPPRSKRRSAGGNCSSLRGTCRERPTLDVVFSALPHLKSAEVCAPLFGKTVVIDLSADFRLRDPAVFQKAYGVPVPKPDLLPRAVYGLAEWHTDAIRTADIIANPGCYPTATLLPLLPLAREGLLKGTVIANAISGISGAGRKEKIGPPVSSSAPRTRTRTTPAHPIGTRRRSPRSSPPRTAPSPSSSRPTWRRCAGAWR